MEQNTHSMAAIAQFIKHLLGFTNEADPRPDDCECLANHGDMPCFDCHMAGFETPA